MSTVDRTHIDRLAADLRESSVGVSYSCATSKRRRSDVRRNLLLACDLDRGEGEELIVSFRPREMKSSGISCEAMLRTQPLSFTTSITRLEAGADHEISIGVRVDATTSARMAFFTPFLPTEQSTGLPFHINADFFPEPDRKAVIFAGHQHEQAWNEMLVDAAALELGRDGVELRETLGDTQFWQVLGRVRAALEAVGHPPIFNRFWDRLKAACANAPVVRAQDDSLRRPAEIILPRGARSLPSR